MSSSDNFDQQFDVIVVGSGGGGITAGLVAQSQGPSSRCRGRGGVGGGGRRGVGSGAANSAGVSVAGTPDAPNGHRGRAAVLVGLFQHDGRQTLRLGNQRSRHAATAGTDDDDVELLIEII